ncbi:MAG: HlyC/CorC family transporter [Candidatus Heimdallarchaeota archaeon]|nr:HlyC/CorC family transporter [Candidatus Heimdallarchaeota archaeon]
MITSFHPWLIALAILLNALFVMSEFILIRIMKPNLEISDGRFGSSSLSKINHDINKHIFASQIGISASTIAFGALTFSAFTQLYTTILEVLPLNEFVLNLVSMTLSYIIVLFLYSFLAEYIPKLYVAGQVVELSGIIAPFIVFFTYVFTPIIWLIRSTTKFFMRLINITQPKNIYSPIYSEDELKHILERSKREGLIEPSEVQMISRIFEFTDMTVKSILTPRPDVIAIEVNEDINDFLKRAKTSKFSKFPIYRKKMENIIGILHLKELAYRNMDNKPFNIMDIKRPFLSIHEGMRLDMLLQKMKQKFTHIAVVFDEFGVFAGIVTLEDVLEALVGTLNEDYTESHEEMIEKITDDIYLINPNISVTEFNRVFQSDIPSEFTSVSSMILDHFEGLPEQERQLKIDNIMLYDFDIERNRIIHVKVKVDGATKIILEHDVEAVEMDS